MDSDDFAEYSHVLFKQSRSRLMIPQWKKDYLQRKESWRKLEKLEDCMVKWGVIIIIVTGLITLLSERYHG